jgi:aspartokinase/homoserine dehydrogenase 1
MSPATIHALTPHLHAEPAAPVDLYLAGVGAVGGALLDQVTTLDGRLLRLVGACTRRGSIWSDAPLDVDAIRTHVGTGTGPHWPETLARLEASDHPTVFVDATGSPEVAGYYERLLGAGVHIATPSKLANTRDQALFDRLRTLSSNGVHYRYEATVGAGLPVVRVVQDLVATGDRVRAVHGVVSGTLTYLFTQLERGVPFSRAVKQAVELGYAEPDPRDDLSGEDVARKFLILARTAGAQIERDAVDVEALVPDEVQGVPLADLYDALAAQDAAWAARTAEARSHGARLRYVGRFEDGAIRVGIQAVPAHTPLGLLHGTDNLVQIRTDRYADSPLTVQGPGAGAHVTAGGVLADALDIARRVASAR